MSTLPKSVEVRDDTMREGLQEASHFRRGPSVYAHQVRPWREDSALMTATD